MTDTKQFTEQHEDLMNVAHQLVTALGVDTPARDVWEIRGILSTLAGKLKVHLVLEDNILYSALLSSSDENVRSVSQQFMDEMGGIAKAFQAYLEKWPHAMAVEERPQEFNDETQAILTVLAERIEKEEKILYPMARTNTEHHETVLPGAPNSVHAA
ncbi:MAG: hemerythrin domain-containing protein [Acidiferrobacterales bacterium]